ncbi:uncharacterized protein [Notamacropus eugenii]|uniref:uncharacterized protein n=1 Tax=Notamacropus eugenii TaxID=9315 RepID=UPI003B675CCC
MAAGSGVGPGPLLPSLAPRPSRSRLPRGACSCSLVPAPRLPSPPPRGQGARARALRLSAPLAPSAGSLRPAPRPPGHVTFSFHADLGEGEGTVISVGKARPRPSRKRAPCPGAALVTPGLRLRLPQGDAGPPGWCDLGVTERGGPGSPASPPCPAQEHRGGQSGPWAPQGGHRRTALGRTPEVDRAPLLRPGGGGGGQQERPWEERTGRGQALTQVASSALARRRRRAPARGDEGMEHEAEPLAEKVRSVKGWRLLWQRGLPCSGDPQNLPKTVQVEAIQFPGMAPADCPCFTGIHRGQHNSSVNLQFGNQSNTSSLLYFSLEPPKH